jgi:hypothetical protein
MIQISIHENDSMSADKLKPGQWGVLTEGHDGVPSGTLCYMAWGGFAAPDKGSLQFPFRGTWACKTEVYMVRHLRTGEVISGRME